MAYQFFAKAHQSKAPTSPPLSPPSSSSSNNRHPKPPIYPPSLVLPQSATSTSIADRVKPPPGKDSSFHPPAYPHPIAPSYKTPHPHVTIESVSTAHIPSLIRITGLLLPIRYPNSFYTATITDPVIASVSRVAIYHDHPGAAAPASTSYAPTSASPLGTSTGTDKVIGGIRCRLERLPPTTAELIQTQSNPHSQEPTNLYIQTLHLLSPYRGCGIAASLLNSLLFSSAPSSFSSGSRSTYQVSELVKHYNVRTVTAHVHEANEEGLKWYIARGFQVEEGVVENYYRRLKPSGARIVKLVLQWNDDASDKAAEADVHSTSNQSGEDNRKSPEEDDDWEKVEAEDGEDNEDHGVQTFTDSKILEVDDGVNRKRKADDEPQRA
ncbi:putative GNAT family acetyltransferase [Aspergillus flavus AF70]|nr:putative GNAT family acetyltransferase [Aspergillus flavus AF70]RAQ48482.1 GNAT family acetyltransferase [Aspergillus flavus]